MTEMSIATAPSPSVRRAASFGDGSRCEERSALVDGVLEHVVVGRRWVVYGPRDCEARRWANQQQDKLQRPAQPWESERCNGLAATLHVTCSSSAHRWVFDAIGWAFLCTRCPASAEGDLVLFDYPKLKIPSPAPGNAGASRQTRAPSGPARAEVLVEEGDASAKASRPHRIA